MQKWGETGRIQAKALTPLPLANGQNMVAVLSLTSRAFLLAYSPSLDLLSNLRAFLNRLGLLHQECLELPTTSGSALRADEQKGHKAASRATS
jgi:hypothetical protein